MRDLAALLRRELERLEAELAADPRAQKAQKIRELLAIYSNPHQIPSPDHSGTPSVHHLALESVKAKQPRFKRLRSAILRLRRAKGTAAVARSRLIAISQSNHWTNASPVWHQLQRDAMGSPLSYDNVLSPHASLPSVILGPERSEALLVNAQSKGPEVLSSR
jgi:hypothetical protein